MERWKDGKMERWKDEERLQLGEKGAEIVGGVGSSFIFYST